MTPEQRSEYLRTLIPGLGILVVYFVGFSTHGQLVKAQAALDSARAAAVSPAAVLPVQQQVAEEVAKQSRIKKDKEAMDERWTRLTAIRTSNPAQRALALRQLTRMLWDRGLVPYEEAPDSGGGGQLPGSFDDVMKRIAAGGTGTQSNFGNPRLWRIRFYGRYRDVSQALSSLADANVGLVPVGLTMSEAHPDTDWRIWTLLLWN